MGKIVRPHKWLITFIGICFGMCFPIMATFLWALENNCTFWEAQTTYTNALIWIINLTPLLLGGLFYFIGLKQDQIRRINSNLDSALTLKLDELEVRNSELEGIFNAFPDMLFHLDDEGVIQSSRSGENPIPSPKGKWEGHKMKELLPKQIEVFFEKAFERVKNEEKVQTLQYELNIAGERKSLEARLISVGNGVLQVVRDITEEKKYLGQLQLKQGQVERQKGMNDLIVTYNHEINNPLTVAYASLKLFNRSGDQEHLDVIKSSLNRIQETVDKISNLKKVSPEDISISAYCGEVDMVNIKSLNLPSEQREFSILIVDDEEIVTNLLNDYFVALGMSQVFKALNAQDAITHLQENKIDLVLTDVVMGEGSGIDIMNYIKENRPETSVIFMSGYFNMNEAEAHNLGAITLLEKPVDTQRLELIIKELIAAKGKPRRVA